VRKLHGLSTDQRQMYRYSLLTYCVSITEEDDCCSGSLASLHGWHSRHRCGRRRRRRCCCCCRDKLDVTIALRCLTVDCTHWHLVITFQASRHAVGPMSITFSPNVSCRDSRRTLNPMNVIICWHPLPSLSLPCLPLSFLHFVFSSSHRRRGYSACGPLAAIVFCVNRGLLTSFSVHIVVTLHALVTVCSGDSSIYLCASQNITRLGRICCARLLDASPKLLVGIRKIPSVGFRARSEAMSQTRPFRGPRVRAANGLNAHRSDFDRVLLQVCGSGASSIERTSDAEGRKKKIRPALICSECFSDVSACATHRARR
jgi:hypothetical protein